MFQIHRSLLKATVSEARDGYYSTRLVYFCYRALLSIPLMCPYHCAVGELLCSGLVGLEVQSSEDRAAMMTIELAFLLLVFFGVTIFGQQLIYWSMYNARRAEEALSAAVEARHGLIEKLCDAEIELSGELGLLEASPSFRAIVGTQLSSALCCVLFLWSRRLSFVACRV